MPSNAVILNDSINSRMKWNERPSKGAVVNDRPNLNATVVLVDITCLDPTIYDPR